MMLNICYMFVNYIIDIQFQSLLYYIHVYSIYSNYVWTPIMDDQKPHIPWNLEVKYSWGSRARAQGDMHQWLQLAGWNCGFKPPQMRELSPYCRFLRRDGVLQVDLLPLDMQRVFWCFFLVFPLHSFFLAIEHTIASTWGWIASRKSRAVPVSKRIPHSPHIVCSVPSMTSRIQQICSLQLQFLRAFRPVRGS